MTVTLKFTGAISETNTITVPDDYPKIQEAINAANPGDTIFVKAGTYNEEWVSVNKSVSLVGDDQKSLVYYHSALGFIVTANNVHISGFTVMSSEAMQGYAISIVNSSDCIIENNLIENNCVGISVYGSSSGNTISGNILEHNERSIELFDSPGNTISDNNITGALVSGISLDVSSGNTVSGNRISDLEDGMGALMLWKSSNNLISRNLLFGGNLMLMINCSSNTFSENFVMDSEYGVVVGVSSNNKIYSNYFINVTQLILDTEIGAGLSSENSWDNGVEGNYWCDYVGADADGDGIGDSPHVLYENNQDNYPLMDYPPISTIATTDSPESTESSSANFTLPTEAIYAIFAAITVILAAVAVLKLRKRKR
ncbi:MAG: right-handed parallel beta-helix repeat-containing protein [Candidatus Bathyarchaeota archaeon]